MKSPITFAFASVMLLAQPALAVPATESAVQANPKSRAYIESGCWACHGTQGQGGQGPALRPNLRPKVVFDTIVRQGTPNGMIPYSHSILPDGQLAEIYTYLQSLPAPTAPELLQRR